MIVKYAGSTPGAIVKTGSSPGLIKYIDFLDGAGGVTRTGCDGGAGRTVIGHSNVAALTAPTDVGHGHGRLYQNAGLRCDPCGDWSPSRLRAALPSSTF